MELIFTGEDGLLYYETCTNLTVQEWDDLINIRIPLIRERISNGRVGCQQASGFSSIISQYLDEIERTYNFSLPLLSNLFYSLIILERFFNSLEGVEEVAS